MIRSAEGLLAEAHMLGIPASEVIIPDIPPSTSLGLKFQVVDEKGGLIFEGQVPNIGSGRTLLMLYRKPSPILSA